MPHATPRNFGLNTTQENNFQAGGSSFDISDANWGVAKGTTAYYGGSSNGSWHGDWSTNDILGCALDIDNDKVYFHRNGTYVQSGDPAGNSGGQAIPSGYIYGFTVGNDTSSNSGSKP